MEKKTIIDKIKELFNEDETVKVEERKFEELKDVNGNILRIEEVVVGAEVLIISGDGEVVSGEAEYELEDGKKIVVDADGKISEIVEAEEAPDEEDDMKKDEEEMSDAIEPTMEEKVAAKVTDKMVELEEKLDDVIQKFEAVSKKVKELSDEPAEEEIKVEKSGFSKKEKINNAIDAIAKFR